MTSTSSGLKEKSQLKKISSERSRQICGRFSLNINLEQIQQHFPVDVVTCEWETRSEVFPSQQVPAIIRHESKTRLGLLTWGLIQPGPKRKKEPDI